MMRTINPGLLDQTPTLPKNTCDSGRLPEEGQLLNLGRVALLFYCTLQDSHHKSPSHYVSCSKARSRVVDSSSSSSYSS